MGWLRFMERSEVSSRFSIWFQWRVHNQTALRPSAILVTARRLIPHRTSHLANLLMSLDILISWRIKRQTCGVASAEPLGLRTGALYCLARASPTCYPFASGGSLDGSFRMRRKSTGPFLFSNQARSRLGCLCALLAQTLLYSTRLFIIF